MRVNELFEMNGPLRTQVEPWTWTGPATWPGCDGCAMRQALFTFLLGCWFAVGCTTSTPSQRTSDIAISGSAVENATDQLPHLTVALWSYYQDRHRWPENPEQLAAFIHENRQNRSENQQRLLPCISGNPDKFNAGKFRRLIFQSEPDGKLSVRFDFELSPPDSLSGTMNIEQPDPNCCESNAIASENK